MQWHRHDEIQSVRVQKPPAMLGKQLPQGLCKQQVTPVLEPMDSLSEGAGIDSRGPGPVKTGRRLSTVSAQMILTCARNKHYTTGAA
jgi:hypothetical protein